MSQQLSLFDALRAPPIIVPVDPDGEVVQGEPHETLSLPHENPKWRVPRAVIQLHREPEGWMWSTSIQMNTSGCGYKVGRKWGKFAASREDALYYAAKEIETRISRPDVEREPAVERRIREWVGQWL